MAVIYDYYRIFYYVAKYRSFTKAANILMSNQPNITRTINKLEQELNCRLFVRSNRGVTLTPEGEKLFVHVQIAQEQLQAGEYEITKVRNLESGSVSIGATDIALHHLLLPVLREFRLSYPQVRIRITNQTVPQAVAAVKNGLVEFAVVSALSGVVKPLKEFRLKEFQDVLVAGPNYRELEGKETHIQELNRYPIICLGRDTKTYEFYNHLFAEYGQVLQPDIEAATIDQILPMIKHDLGIGFLPERFAEEAIKKGEVFVVKLAEPIPQRHICLVLDRSRPMSIAAQELLHMLL